MSSIYSPECAQLSVAFPVNTTGYLPPCWNRHMWRANSCFLKVLFHGFLFMLTHCWAKSWRVGRGCQGAFQVPLLQPCICRHRCHCQRSFPALHIHRGHESWADTWYLVTAHTVNTAPGCSRATDADGGPWRQPKPQIPVRGTSNSFTSPDSTWALYSAIYPPPCHTFV